MAKRAVKQSSIGILSKLIDARVAVAVCGWFLQQLLNFSSNSRYSLTSVFIASELIEFIFYDFMLSRTVGFSFLQRSNEIQSMRRC